MKVEIEIKRDHVYFYYYWKGDNLRLQTSREEWIEEEEVVLVSGDVAVDEKGHIELVGRGEIKEVDLSVLELVNAITSYQFKQNLPYICLTIGDSHAFTRSILSLTFQPTDE